MKGSYNSHSRPGYLGQNAQMPSGYLQIHSCKASSSRLSSQSSKSNINYPTSCRSKPPETNQTHIPLTSTNRQRINSQAGTFNFPTSVPAADFPIDGVAIDLESRDHLSQTYRISRPKQTQKTLQGQDCFSLLRDKENNPLLSDKRSLSKDRLKTLSSIISTTNILPQHSILREKMIKGQVHASKSRSPRANSSNSITPRSKKQIDVESGNLYRWNNPEDPSSLPFNTMLSPIQQNPKHQISNESSMSPLRQQTLPNPHLRERAVFDSNRYSQKMEANLIENILDKDEIYKKTREENKLLKEQLKILKNERTSFEEQIETLKKQIVDDHAKASVDMLIKETASTKKRQSIVDWSIKTYSALIKTKSSPFFISEDLSYVEGQIRSLMESLQEEIAEMRLDSIQKQLLSQPIKSIEECSPNQNRDPAPAISPKFTFTNYHASTNHANPFIQINEANSSLSRIPHSSQLNLTSSSTRRSASTHSLLKSSTLDGMKLDFNRQNSLAFILPNEVDSNDACSIPITQSTGSQLPTTTTEAKLPQKPAHAIPQQSQSDYNDASGEQRHKQQQLHQQLITFPTTKYNRDDHSTLSNKDQSTEQQEQPIQIPHASKSSQEDEFVIALFDFNPQREKDITFKKDDRIQVIRKNPNGWWVGIANHRIGYFPYNYVSSIQ